MGTFLGQTGTVTSASTLAANNAAGKAAEAAVVADIQGQGILVQPQVTLMTGAVRCIADCALNGAPNAAVQVPQGFVAEDIYGNVLVDGNGNPISSFNLNSQGQALVEVKTGNAKLT